VSPRHLKAYVERSTPAQVYFAVIGNPEALPTIRATLALYLQGTTMLTNGFTNEEIVACKRARTVICIKSVVLYRTTRKVFRAGVEYEILSADWLWMTVRNDEGKPHSMHGTWFREHFIAGPAVVIPDSTQPQFMRPAGADPTRTKS
jgi:hypothetical protein